MPLWVYCLRLRVWRRSSALSTSSPKRQSLWRSGLFLRRSYNTALLESQPDETSPLPEIPTLAASFNNERSPYVIGHKKSKRWYNVISLKGPLRPNQAGGTSIRHAAPTVAHRRSAITRKGWRLDAQGRPTVLALRRKLAYQGTSRLVLRRQTPRRSVGAVLALTAAKSTTLQHDLFKKLVKERKAWKKRLEAMTKAHKEEHGEEAFGLKWVAVAGSHADDWAETVLQLLERGESTISQGAMSHGTRDSAYVWREVALWILVHNPREMPKFLLATRKQHFQMDQIVVCLRHLATYWTQSLEDDRISQLERLADAFCVLADGGADKRMYFFNPFFRILIKYCSDKHISDCYRTIKLHNVQTHWNTYLHFTTYFAKNSHFEEALDALMAAKDAGADLNSWEFRSNCTTLLRRSSEEADGLRVCLRIVSTLTDIGVKLNEPICDIIMLNAVEAGDLKTAFSIYHSLVDRGLQPTESTFAVLLKGCKMDIDDAETLNHTIRDAIQHVAVRTSDLCASEILHCLALHHSKHNPKTALQTLAEAYSQLFDVRPLYKLGLPIPRIPQEHEEFMPPSPQALNFMIGATIDHYLERLPYTEGIVPIYDRWREQVEAGIDRPLAKLATLDYTANIFLKAFILRPDGLIHATKVMRDMQRELPSSAGVEQIKPSVQSWSIFLHGFMRHGKTKLAEQVLNYMRSKGVEPNHVTWNTLVTGYARAQDDEGTVDALRRAEEGGLVWDQWTHGGLRLLKDQRRLKNELDLGRLRQQLDFTSELRQGLGARFVDVPESAQADAGPVDSNAEGL